jgi:ABC-type transport system involved in multi-copper enzyme maturation permease subunit
VATSATLLPL